MDPPYRVISSGSNSRDSCRTAAISTSVSLRRYITRYGLMMSSLTSSRAASGTILPKSIVGKAIFYTLTRWEKLTRFIEHPVIELSTNWAENSMRPIAIGRKNWLHLGSKEAGPKIAAIFSIVESCRKLDVPIRQYLADVLPGLADRSIQSLDELTPTAYAAKAAK